jgi:hypothetical protein
VRFPLPAPLGFRVMQPGRTQCLSNLVFCWSYCGHAPGLVCRRSILYGKSKVGSLESEMLRLTNLDSRWRRSCSAIVVVLAVASLAVSVATRYCSPESSSAYSSSTLHKHSSPEPSRQRLTKSAANWIPPVVRTVALEPPTSYPRIAPAGPPMPRVLLELSLYNRPPPSC